MRNVLFLSLLTLGLCPCFEVRLFADKGREAESQLPELVDLIAELGHPEFERRREAFLKIWKKGDAAVAQVQQAKDSPDLQIARAAAALHPLLLMREEPDGEVAELVIAPTPEKIAKLCELGHWGVAEQTIIRNAKLKQQFQGSVATYYLNQLARTAAEQGNPLQAWPIVRATKRPDPQDYNGADLSIWLAIKNGFDLQPIKNSPDHDALCALYAGDIELASQQNVTPELRLRLLSRFGLWEQFRVPEDRARVLGDKQGPARKAAEAVLLEYAGNFRAADDLWNELLRLERGTPDEGKDETGLAPSDQAALRLIGEVPSTDRNQIVFALLASGRSAAVPAYFESTNPKAAFSYYASNSDYLEAFRILGLQPDLSNFEQWIVSEENRLVTQASLPGRQAGSAAFSQAAQFCNMLVGLGFQAEAERYFEVLCEAADTNTYIWGDAIALWMSRGESRSLALRIIEKHYGKLPSDAKREILNGFFSEFDGSESLLARSRPEFKTGGLNPPPLLETLDRLHAWDNEYFVSQGTSIEAWIRKARSRSDNSPSNTRSESPVLHYWNLAKIARGSGYEDLALEIALADVPGDTGTAPLHRIVAAEILLQRGEAKRAVEALEQLQESAYGVHSQATSVLQTKALLLAGRYEEALEVDQSRWMRPMSVTRFYQGPYYSQVVNRLSEQSEFESALEYANLVYQMADYSSMDFYWAAGDLSRIHEERKDLFASAQALRGPLLEALRPRSSQLDFQFANQYVHLLKYNIKRERIHRAAGDIERGYYRSAEHHMRVGQRLQPQDIEMVVACYPRLVDAGKNEMAERLFASYEATMEKQLEQWPNDAMALNNLAWMYSQCDRKLDRALRLSRQAVSLAPSSATYLDTLAEVLYRSGQVEAALAAMQQCVHMDPRDQHYRENLERFATRQP